MKEGKKKKSKFNESSKTRVNRALIGTIHDELDKILSPKKTALA